MGRVGADPESKGGQEHPPHIATGRVAASGRKGVSGRFSERTRFPVETLGGRESVIVRLQVGPATVAGQFQNPCGGTANDRGIAMTAIDCSVESRSSECVGRLAQCHYDIVVRYVSRWGSRDLAEDVAQEVFLRLMALPNVAERELSAGYLIAVARNILRRNAQKNKRAAEALAALRAARGHDDESDQAPGRAEAGSHVEARSLQAALGSLSDKHQDAVRLLVCRGLSYRAAAAAMNVGLNTVHTWELRGIDRMRRRLGRAGRAKAA